METGKLSFALQDLTSILMEEEKRRRHHLAEEDQIHLLLVDNNRIQFLILSLAEVVISSTELIFMDLIFLTVLLDPLKNVVLIANPPLVVVHGHSHMEFVT
jgi:hypothetical protein